jgi:hypothetical protein
MLGTQIKEDVAELRLQEIRSGIDYGVVLTGLTAA